MSKLYTYFSFILILIFIFFTYYSISSPNDWREDNVEDAHFQLKNAMNIISEISKEPHYVGSRAHNDVKLFLIEYLKNLGLSPQLQEGYFINEQGVFCKVNNIIARINGTSNNGALMLLSHYDSSPHSSYGASDAASGVAAILEGIRNVREGKIKLNNDLVIMFSDAEELGLNGARYFVKEHPWIGDIKLVINFEARGTSGPSFMLIETKKGNASLVNALAESNIRNPIGNSLFYEIYKLMPNDTDLTAFIETGNIEGYNLAFIDDYYFYHTSMDNIDNMDPNSLKHQGEYLLKLLKHFGTYDISKVSIRPSTSCRARLI